MTSGGGPIADQATASAGFREWLTAQWAHRAIAFTVEVEGARLAGHTWNADATHLPGLVLVHGFRAHSHWWDHIAPSFLDTHRVVAFDLSGMGDSTHRPDYARSQHGREIIAVAEACNIAQPVVVAHSYGGLVAMVAARARPDAFGRLIAIDSAIPFAGARHLIREQPRRLYPDRESAISRFRLIPASPFVDRLLARHVAAHAVRESAQGWCWKFDADAARSLNIESDFHESVTDIRVRSDFIHGALSPVVTPERLALVPRVLPMVQRPIAIPLAHHHVLLEQPIALIATVRALLLD
jgi:pimeloyl-ACP methyl ester carboxylesterase